MFYQIFPTFEQKKSLAFANGIQSKFVERATCIACGGGENKCKDIFVHKGAWNSFVHLEYNRLPVLSAFSYCMIAEVFLRPSLLRDRRVTCL